MRNGERDRELVMYTRGQTDLKKGKVREREREREREGGGEREGESCYVH